ncbi:MAG: hypothetical protein V3T53_00090 [Phycisphaerales bacterium]
MLAVTTVVLKPILCLFCCGALACAAFLAIPNPALDRLHDADCSAASPPTDTESSVPISERTAINDICPISGDSVGADAPTVEYQGFTIAVSSKHNGEVFLKNMTDKERDAFVIQHVEYVRSGCAVTGCAAPTYQKEWMVTHDGLVAPLCCAACYARWHQSDEKQRDAWVNKFVKPVLARSDEAPPIRTNPIEFHRNSADGTLTIGAIDPDGIFQDSGLAVGDVLLAINGRSAAKVPPDKFRAFIEDSFLTPEPPVFTVNRDGQTLDIPVRIDCAPPAQPCAACGDINCSGDCGRSTDLAAFDGPVRQLEGMTCGTCVDLGENARSWTSLPMGALTHR